MEKINVYILSDKDTYKVYRQSDDTHLKTLRTQYVARLISEHQLFFLENNSKKVSAEELCALAEHHYRELSKQLLISVGQPEMAAKLSDAKVAYGKIDYDMTPPEEKIYSIIFDNNFSVRVSDLHFRLFAARPLFGSSTLQFTQTVLAL